MISQEYSFRRRPNSRPTVENLAGGIEPPSSPFGEGTEAIVEAVLDLPVH